MEKKATINLRIDNDLKIDAEQILNRLGLTMSTAITLFLRQVELTGGLPFPVQLPPGPKHLDISNMSEDDFNAYIEQGIHESNNDQLMYLSDVISEYKASRKK